MKKVFPLKALIFTSAIISAVSVQGQFRLQILHSSDMEAGIAAVSNAPHFAAIVDSLEEVYPLNTIKLSGGDNFIPSPFLNASTDAQIRPVFQSANGKIFNDVANTSSFRENYARVDMALMNAIGFHASAVGNHEFDLGPGVFSDAIRIETSGSELRWSGTMFPYLSSNLDFSSESALAGLFTSEIKSFSDYITTPDIAATVANTKKIAPATFVNINGEKIGILGATTQILESISSVGNVRVKGSKSDNMTELATYIQPYIDELINTHGCNKIILLSHLQQIHLEKELVSKLSGVDIIVAAGSHTLQADADDVLRNGDVKKETYPFITKNKDNEDALIVSTDGEWKYVGRLVVDFDETGKVLLNSLNENINGAYATDSAGVVRVWGDYDKAFLPQSKGAIAKELCNAVLDVIIKQDGNIFGRTSVYLEGRRTFVRTQETNFGNLTAEANLWYAQKIDPTVQVSVKNGGGIRSAIGEVVVNGVDNKLQLMPPSANPLAGKQNGDISQLDILNSLRFNNGLTLVTVTADQLKKTIEHAVSSWAESATPGAFPQVAGIRFRFDPKKSAGDKLTELMIVDSAGRINDVILQRGMLVGNPNRPIRVVSLNFLVDQSGSGPLGGDGYPFNVFVLQNPSLADKISITKTSTDPKTGNATFAADGSEQDVLAEYLFEKYRTTPYTSIETPANKDNRIQNLFYKSDFFSSNERKIIYSKNNVDVYNGGFGSDMARVPGKDDEFYLLTDRGSNADSSSTSTTKIFSNPDFAPQIGHFKFYGDSIVLVKKIELKSSNGNKLTGLPNPVGAGNTGEFARDLDLNLLPNDPEGIDPEGLVATSDGSFWISDEYGPHLLHVDENGKTIERINPYGTGLGGRTLPKVLAKRRPNRGMEGLTITPDGKTLVGIMQSTLHNPSSSGLNAKTTRIVTFNIETGKSQQYVYIQEKNNNSNSGIAAVSDSVFIVLERDGDFQGGTPDALYKRFYLIDIRNATNVCDPMDGTNGKLYDGKTLEQLTTADLAAAGIIPVTKTLVSDLLADLPSYPHDKLEGFSIINDSTIAVVNDDDFGVTPDLQGGYLQKVLPAYDMIDNNLIYFVKLRSKLELENIITAATPEVHADNKSVNRLVVYPNPASEVIYFSKTITAGKVYDILGNAILDIKNADDLRVDNFESGIYIIHTSENETIRISVK